MQLLRLRLFHFGSFRDEINFTFPEQPGLYFLRGENDDEPALGANGAGKSTFWNAICWVLFDRTVKGLRAGDVANWDEPKGARVDLDYANASGQICRITRQHSPNKWLHHTEDAGEPIDLTKDGTNPALADLRLALQPFLNSVLMGQGRPMFLDLSAPDKASLFSDVLGLEAWIERSTKASKAAREQDEISRELERRLAHIDGSLKSIDHKSLEGSASEWKAEQDERLHKLDAKHARGREELKALKAAGKDKAEAAEVARSALREALDILKDTRERVRAQARKSADAKSASDEGERICHHLSNAAIKLRDFEVCPTCFQQVPEAQRRGLESSAWDRSKVEARKQVDRWKDDNVEHKLLQEMEEELAKGERAVDKWRDVVTEVEQLEKAAQRNIDFLNRDLDHLEDEAERIEQERNPFASLRQEALDREANLLAQRKDLERRLDDSEAQRYLFSYWVTGFKELRLQQIDDSLEHFEIEVNNNLAELGLVGWELRFEVDKETKSGTIKRGFNVRVLSPHNKESVPWESWSGGEGQRLRLATQAGLADLIRARTGTRINLEVWDEPTEHLSGQGVTDLLDALADRARREHRQIWLVDHRSLGYGAFTDVYTVVKDSQGSHIKH